MRNGVCVTSENDNHPYVALRILRISIRAMVVCQLWWHRHCDVNVGALTGLLANTHNALHPCTSSLPTMPCIHASLPIMPCIPVLHHYPQCPASLPPGLGAWVSISSKMWGVPSPPPLACMVHWAPHREAVAVAMLSSCCFSGSLGSSSASFLSWPLGK